MEEERKSEELENIIEICHNCGCEINVDNDDDYLLIDGDFICRDCIDNNYTFCNGCESYQCDNGDFVRTEDTEDIYCSDCANDLYYCECCGDYFEDSNSIYHTRDNNCVCDNCYHNNYFTCEDCGEVFNCDYQNHNEDDDCYYCDDCYDKNTSIIKDYHEHQGQYHMHALCDEDTRLYFGFELEVENDSNRYDNDEMAEEIDNIMNNLVVFEKDGSLDNGFEIISHPMSFDYMESRKGLINAMLEKLSNNGFVSHNNSNCGLHFHMSRTAFENCEDSIDKLQFLIEKFKKELTIFSRRSSEKIDTWCQFLSDFNDTDEGLSIDWIKKHKDTSRRYQVLNLCNDNTVEFRLIRGTLNPTTFFASIQLLNNLVKLANDRSDSELVELSFDDVIEVNNCKELNEYCEKRHLLKKEVV